MQSTRVDERINALHQLVGTDKALPILEDLTIRTALIDLLKHETQISSHSGLHERVDYQYYESFLLEVVQKIAQEHPTPDVGAALAYSIYAARSPFGQWLAKQPQTYPLMLKWIDDDNFVHRNQAFEMLGEICSVDNGARRKIMPLLYERIDSSDGWTNKGRLAR